MLIHLVQAIAVNLLRMIGYAIRSRGRSIPVSMLLVSFEMASIPLSIVFDLWGKLRLKLSLSKIFISMRHIHQAGRSPRYQKPMSWKMARELQSQIMSFFKAASAGLRGEDWDGFISSCASFLEELTVLEGEKEHHLGMSKHLMESIGWTALFGQLHIRKKGNGELYFTLLTWTQLSALPLTILFDYLASKAHRFGVGIIVNDVPDIPFLKNFEDFKKQTSRHQ